MKSRVFFCTLLILIPIFCIQTVSAQPDLEDLISAGEWDIGFKDGENITVELNDNGEVDIDFWVHNEYQIDIEVSFDFGDALGSTSNELDSTTVAMGNNDSFVLEFSEVDILKYRAEKRESFEITVTIESYGGIPIATEEKTIAGELTIPRIRGFEIEIEELGGSMNAGTELDINIEIKNIGNDMDLTAEPRFESKSCPQLDISNIEALDEVSIDAALEGQSGMKTIVVTLSATLSHPSKNCDLKIELNSLGSINDGDNISPAEDEITFEIKKSSSTEENIDSGNSNSNSKENDGDIVSSNFAPSFSFTLTILSFLCAIVLIKRK